MSLVALPQVAAPRRLVTPRVIATLALLVVSATLFCTVIGFVLATFLFLAAFIYLGRYRRHAVVWAFSGTMTVLMAILFLRIAYVSLPRGIAPFDRIADLFLLIPGVW